MFKNSQRAPFYIFGTMRLTSDQKNSTKFSNRKISENFFQFFSNAGTVEENTWHFEVLLLFWALDMAPTWAVHGLFHVREENRWWRWFGKLHWKNGFPGRWVFFQKVLNEKETGQVMDFISMDFEKSVQGAVRCKNVCYDIKRATARWYFDMRA